MGDHSFPDSCAFIGLSSDILYLIVQYLCARDITSLESTCHTFRQPAGKAPNRYASEFECLAFKRCLAHPAMAASSQLTWSQLLTRCDGQWKRVLHFLDSIDTAQSSLVSAGCYESIIVASGGSLIRHGSSYPLPLPTEEVANKVETIPTSLIGNSKAVAVSVGQSQIVVINEHGQVYTCGKDVTGSLGLGVGLENCHVPKPALVTFPNSVTIKQVSAGYKHTLALTTAGEVYAWGHGANGRLGTGNTDNQFHPVLVTALRQAGTVRQVAAGSSHSMALLDTGVVYTFGCNDIFQLGQEGSEIIDPCPLRVLQDRSIHIVAIEAGDGNSAAIDSSGHVYTWGDNGCGCLGQGNDQSLLLFQPTMVEALRDVRVVQVSMKKRKSLFLTDTGAVYSCGWGATGALGVKTKDGKIGFPTLVDGHGLLFSSLSTGWYHSIALSSSGIVVGFGDNDEGQVGSNHVDKFLHAHIVDRNSPLPVMTG